MRQKERAKRQPNMGRFEARIWGAIAGLGRMWTQEYRDLDAERERARTALTRR